MGLVTDRIRDMETSRERLLISQLHHISAIIDNAEFLHYNEYVKQHAYAIFYEYKRQLSLESAQGQSQSVST